MNRRDAIRATLGGLALAFCGRVPVLRGAFRPRVKPAPPTTTHLVRAFTWRTRAFPSPPPVSAIAEAVGCVNGRQFGQFAPGTLLLVGCDTERTPVTLDGESSLVASWQLSRSERPWGELMARDGTWRPWVDSRGRGLYEAADFDAILPPADELARDPQWCTVEAIEITVPLSFVA